MATEIANCPYCGSDAVELVGGPVGIATNVPMRVLCGCGYISQKWMGEDDAIAAHNALCADVTLARNLRKAFAVVQYVEIGANPPKGVICARINVFDPIEGDTLATALAQLAEKIGGSNE